MRFGTHKLTAFVALLAVAYALPAIAGDLYPLDTCVISGKKLGSMGDPVVLDHEGQTVQLCCKGCEKPFTSNPEKGLEKIKAAIIADQKPIYPMDTCLVSGKKLEEGKAKEIVKDGRLYMVCCGGCVGKVAKDDGALKAKLDEAVIAAQLKDYPLTDCPVSGHALDSEEPKNLIIAGTLVRVCCEGCEKPLLDDPADAVKKVREARK